jgi:dissimilatory sulfite reductase (desulfoviridin) alpha/beta subunit
MTETISPEKPKPYLIAQKEEAFRTVRLHVTGGFAAADALLALAQLARKYGRGHVHLTMRQGIEIPYVPVESLAAFEADLVQAGLSVSACGASVRTITACQGASCRHGLIDSQAVARRLDERFFGLPGLPHKFKIGVTGCPNACIKPLENDLGIMGIAKKRFDQERCEGCGLCARACPMSGALKVIDKQVFYHPESCVHCGKCAAVCPTGAWENTGVRYALFVGGKMGKRIRLAEPLPIEVADEEKLVEVVGKVIEWYRTHGIPGERFGSTIDRLGMNELVSGLCCESS